MSIYEDISEYLRVQQDLVIARKLVRDLNVKKKKHESIILEYLEENNLPGAKITGYTLKIYPRKYKDDTRNVIKVIKDMKDY